MARINSEFDMRILYAYTSILYYPHPHWRISICIVCVAPELWFGRGVAEAITQSCSVCVHVCRSTDQVNMRWDWVWMCRICGRHRARCKQNKRIYLQSIHDGMQDWFCMCSALDLCVRLVSWLVRIESLIYLLGVLLIGWVGTHLNTTWYILTALECILFQE